MGHPCKCSQQRCRWSQGIPSFTCRPCERSPLKGSAKTAPGSIGTHETPSLSHEAAPVSILSEERSQRHPLHLPEATPVSISPMVPLRPNSWGRHTKYIQYIPRVPQCLSSRLNWDPLPPLPLGSVSLPPEPKKRGDNTLARGWGGGGSQFGRLEKMPLQWTPSKAAFVPTWGLPCNSEASALQMKVRWESKINVCMVPIFVFPEMKLHGLVIFKTELLYNVLFCSQIGRPILGIYINRLQIHECRNWEPGCTVSFLGTHKSYFWYSAHQILEMRYPLNSRLPPH
jgi:hypothetical protein